MHSDEVTKTEGPEIMGRSYIAETDAGKQVRIQVSGVDETFDHGWTVWGYRVNTKARRTATTSYPRRYWLPRT